MARQHRGYQTPSDLADTISTLVGREIPAAHVEALESGQATASSTLVQIAIACGVRPEWLMMGEEPMTRDGAISEFGAIPAELSKDRKRLLRGYDAASPKMKKAFLRFADFVALAMDPEYEAFIAQKRAENDARFIDDDDDDDREDDEAV